VILTGGPNQGEAGTSAGTEDGVNPTALFLARLRIPVETSLAGGITRLPSDVAVANELREFVLSTSALAAWAGMPAPSTPDP
jgi:hypothetical protein